MKNKLAIFKKGENYGALGVIISDDMVLISSWDSRTKQIKRGMTKIGSTEMPSFDSQLEETIDNGWGILYEGVSFLGNYKLN